MSESHDAMQIDDSKKKSSLQKAFDKASTLQTKHIADDCNFEGKVFFEVDEDEFPSWSSMDVTHLSSQDCSATSTNTSSQVPAAADNNTGSREGQ